VFTCKMAAAIVEPTIMHRIYGTVLISILDWITEPFGRQNIASEINKLHIQWYGKYKIFKLFSNITFIEFLVPQKTS
jgi:hypothetical protein